MSSSVKYFDRQNRAVCAMIAPNQMGILCYTCLECDAEFGSATSYEAHKLKEHTITIQKVQSLAPNTSAVKSDVKCKRGIKMNHSGTDSLPKKRFTCFACSKEFATKESTRRHIYRIHRNYPHKCSACIKSFKTEEQLEKHKSSHGTEIKYKCSICEKGLLTVYEEKKHMQEMHSSRRS